MLQKQGSVLQIEMADTKKAQYPSFVLTAGKCFAVKTNELYVVELAKDLV